MSAPKEDDVATHEIDGEQYTIRRLTWGDGGLSFDVYQGDDCLTMDESFDVEPTVEQVIDLIDWRNFDAERTSTHPPSRRS